MVEHVLGEGFLATSSIERYTDRRGAVWLVGRYDPTDGAIPVVPDLGEHSGQFGTLVAEVVEARVENPNRRFPSSDDIGASVGEVVELGTGVLFSEPAWVSGDTATTAVGVKPVDGRATDWMDSMALVRAGGGQKVRLIFRPSA
ncbi:hypothetical protein E1091_00270 [Micromonospora fluostatini]|uniref:Uncharacterized protein n=1 Tax=Micromonospora fluostatini TaxID=1629071 RepID=A0ABY2DM99_9ACTN|nr:hypothetical protein E1091_00270 [Micromonospora fluostatini]